MDERSLLTLFKKIVRTDLCGENHKISGKNKIKYSIEANAWP